ncbi:MAG: tetratricopeptide repeat protein [Terriglobales bacterium]
MLNRTLLICSLSISLIAPAVLLAQTSSTAPKATAPAVANQAPKAKSKAEAVAVRKLQKMATDDATTPAEMDTALTNFATQFPDSEFLGAVAAFGLRYYQTFPHKDYEKSLIYGEQAIQHDPNSVYALTTVGTIIAGHVQSTDLDRAQRVAEATKDDQAAIQVANTAGPKINGQPFPQSARNLTKAFAYISLAELATKDKDYGAAVSDYQQAANFDAPPSNANDYFLMARVQVEAKQYKAALSSLDMAAKAAPNNPQVQALVASNRKVIQEIEKQNGQ